MLLSHAVLLEGDCSSVTHSLFGLKHSLDQDEDAGLSVWASAVLVFKHSQNYTVYTGFLMITNCLHSIKAGLSTVVEL